MMPPLLVILLTGLAAPVMHVEGPVQEGQKVSLRLTADQAGVSGVAVSALYRQNAHAALQHEQSIGAPDPAGRVRWIPEEAGVVVLSWAGGQLNVSVSHAGVPVSGVVVLVLAGVLLLGGAGLFFVRMLRQTDSG